MSFIIQLRRDVPANWTSINPVLANGELGVEVGTARAKLGDGVTEWNALTYWNPAGAASGDDKNYTQSFTVASTVNVNHQLNKYPAVSVLDSAEDEVEGDVAYVDLNHLTVTFSAPFSGTVVCN